MISHEYKRTRHCHRSGSASQGPCMYSLPPMPSPCPRHSYSGVNRAISWSHTQRVDHTPYILGTDSTHSSLPVQIDLQSNDLLHTFTRPTCRDCLLSPRLVEAAQIDLLTPCMTKWPETHTGPVDYPDGPAHSTTRMHIALILVLSFFSGCSGSRVAHETDHGSRTDRGTGHADPAWSEERKAIYEQAREGLRLSRERYIETTRPALQRKFRDEYPHLSEAQIDTLVNGALEKGFRPETTRPPERPLRQSPMHCAPSTWGGPPQTNCY